MPSPRLLTIETTCDETAAAVIDHTGEVLSSVVASQDHLHERFGGVVPEIASRAHVERILPVIHEALERASTTLDELDGVAVAHTPGLAGSLLVGLSAAKALCVARGLPLVAVNHLQAHIYACQMTAQEPVYPCVGLIVSGGHSNLYRCDSPIEFRLLGSTVDDAAGEAFDKVASMLGLPYPGGPAIGKAAEAGNRAAFAYPRPLIDDTERLDFSFSGLKTAVRYQLFGPGRIDDDTSQIAAELQADVAASFQEAVVDCLLAKSELALAQTGLSTLCVGGGVAANRRLRERLEASSQRHKYRLHIAPPALCTDNAAMGAVALESFRAGALANLDLDITSGLERMPGA